MKVDSLDNQLLIGSPEGVITDGQVPMRICKNIFDGITVARCKEYQVVWVVYAALSEPRSQALQAIVSVCPDVPVILLVQMADEPQVREIIRSNPWAYGLNYLICPLTLMDLMYDSPEMHTAVDEDDLVERIRQLEILVMQDDMTGLKNRRYLRRFLPAILQQAHLNQSKVTLLLFDIDNFKHYNDTYGHSVGDDVLRQTAELMQRCCRTQDVVARLGGDEFAVVFWNTASLNDEKIQVRDRRHTHQNHPREAVFMSERFRREMSEKTFDLLGEKGKGRLTISGGMATFPEDAQTAESLFECADQAMLEAKRSGKNRITLVGEPT